jgi:hypothetical protein
VGGGRGLVKRSSLCTWGDSDQRDAKALELVRNVDPQAQDLGFDSSRARVDSATFILNRFTRGNSTLLITLETPAQGHTLIFPFVPYPFLLFVFLPPKTFSCMPTIWKALL